MPEIKEVMDQEPKTSVASDSQTLFTSSSSSSTFFLDLSSSPQEPSDGILSPTILPTVMSSISDSLTYSSEQIYSEASSSSISYSSSYDSSNEQRHFDICSNINFNAWDQKNNASNLEMLNNLKQWMSIINNLDSEPPLKYIITIMFYSLIVVVSSLGNLFVIWAIFSKKRTRTIVNIFIGNLACSDLMMTIFNIPFNVARLLMSNWIFGETLCHVVPFVQATSVYVSTLTMAFIAVDRFQAILRPMKPRISSKVGSCVAILIIWITSCLFSVPFLLFNRVVVRTDLFRPLTRCLVVYPEPYDLYKKSINVTTFILQFAIPLTVMVCLYTKIGMKIWSRVAIGATTREQETRQMAAKRKTIIMLLLVAIVFALCWLPLNLYHLLVDFAGFQNDFNTLIVVHWLAMSSVCYNPFIYFWLNRRRFEQIVRPGLISLCKRACCGCESTLICPMKYAASSPTETSPPPETHELKRMRSCRRCHHGYHDDQGNDTTDGVHDAGTFSDVSEAMTARELKTREKPINNLSTSPFESTSISLQVNQIDIPMNGRKSQRFLTTSSNSFSNFKSINSMNNHLSVQLRNQHPRHALSLSSKCFSCNVCQNPSISEETASVSVTRLSEQQRRMIHSNSFQPQRSDNKKTSNKSTSPEEESSSNNKKIWRYRNHHAIKARNNKNPANLGLHNNFGFNNSLSEEKSSGSSCSSGGRGDWKHHQHHIKCHYSKNWGKRDNNRKTLKIGKEELTLTSL